MIWRITYWTVITCYAAFIAVILSDKFPAFFNNFAVQITGVCAGMACLYYLWNHRPEGNRERGSAVERHR